jgi:tetratricopeptide (TPR) repeat protein/CHAT domain-containing protein
MLAGQRSVCALLWTALLTMFAAGTAVAQDAEAKAPSTSGNSTSADSAPLDESQRAQLLKERDSLDSKAGALWREGKLSEALDAARSMLSIELRLFGPVYLDVANTYELLAKIHEQREDWPAAEEARQKVLDIKAQLYGKDNWRAADARTSLDDVRVLQKLTSEQRRQLRQAAEFFDQSSTLAHQGNYRNAAQLAEQTAAIRKRILGEHDHQYAEALDWLGYVLERQGDYPAAERALLGAVEVAKQALGEGHPVYGRCLGNLATVYDNTGRYEKAEPLFRQAVGICKQSLGTENTDYAKSVAGLAELYKHIGDYAKAEPLYREASDVYKRTLGEKHGWYGSSLNNLALLYQDMGDYKRAEPLLREALEIAKVANGEKHPQYADSLLNLAELLSDMGNYSKAEPLAREASDIYKEALGQGHPRYAISLNNLAGLYTSMGKYTQAEPLYLQAQEIDKSVLGETNPQYITDLNNLASLYHHLGAYGKALPIAQQALELREKVFGPEHPVVAVSLDNLAGLYEAQGDYTRAIPLCKRALAIREKALGPEHPDTAFSVNNLAKLYEHQGNYAEALRLCQRGLSIREKALGPEHPDTATSLSCLAELYQAQGRFADALPHCLRANRIYERALGPTHPFVAVSLGNLAELYEAQGNYADALPLFQRALQINERALGADHPATATTVNNLAGLYEAQGSYADALPLYERALRIKQNSLGPNHPEVAIGLNNLGGLYRRMYRYQEAVPLLEQALKISEAAFGPDHPSVAYPVDQLAWVYVEQGKYSEAVPLFQRTLTLLQKNFGAEHPLMAEAENHLGTLFEAQGRFSEAIEYLQRSCESSGRMLELTAAAQSERQQIANIQKSRSTLDSLLSCALRTAGSTVPVYDQILSWKGSVTLRQRLSHAARRADDLEEQKSWQELQAVGTRLAATSRATPTAEQQDAWRSELNELSRRKDELEAELSQRSTEFRQLRSQTKLTYEMLARELPAKVALVDLLEFSRRIDERQPDNSVNIRWENRLAAFVARKGRPVAMLDLGLREGIDDAVQEWRETFGSPVRGKLPDEQAGVRLRQLVWKPLAKYLDGIDTVLVSPDGELAKLPWGALPGSKPDGYLLEDVALVVIPVPQMLPTLLEEKADSRQDDGTSLLLVGNVDYGASPGKLQSLPEGLFAINETRAAIQGPGRMHFSALPGTANEIDLIDHLYHQRFESGHVLDLSRSEATQQRLREEAPKHRYLHMATHGFFDPPTVAGVGANFDMSVNHIVVTKLVIGGAAARDGRLRIGDQILAVASGDDDWTSLEGKTVNDMVAITRGPTGTKVRLRIQPAAGGEVAEYVLTRLPFAAAGPSDSSVASGLDPQLASLQPGLLSGIALAGANVPPQPDQDDGIMTALEVASLDLQNVDLAVLSACETGLGQATRGEGMLGLQRAFQVAGARTAVSSLWSVDDAATQTLMVEFYKRLWDKEHPMGKLEALRQAQLEMLNHYDPKQQKLLDRSPDRGLAREAAVSDGSGRLSPKYWAAFVLSGDWR